MVQYLEACLEEAGDDAAFIAKALGTIARARGMTQPRDSLNIGVVTNMAINPKEVLAALPSEQHAKVKRAAVLLARRAGKVALKRTELLAENSSTLARLTPACAQLNNLRQSRRLIGRAPQRGQ